MGMFARTLFPHRAMPKGQANYGHPPEQDEFDRCYGVETSTRVHLTDLKIDSPNWIYAGGCKIIGVEFSSELHDIAEVPGNRSRLHGFHAVRNTTRTAGRVPL